MFAYLVYSTASKYAYLLKSPALSAYEKRSFEKFLNQKIFCPWDVMNFIKDNYKFKQRGQEEFIRSGNYRSSSTSSTEIYEYLGYLSDKDNERLQDLVDGKSVRVCINDSMHYDCLSKHDPDDFWSLLLHTGYLIVLRAGSTLLTPADVEFLVKIPNREVRKCFEDNIKKDLTTSLLETAAERINLPHIFWRQTAKKAADLLFEILQSYVSVRDFATKAPKENYYYVFFKRDPFKCTRDQRIKIQSWSRGRIS